MPQVKESDCPEELLELAFTTCKVSIVMGGQKIKDEIVVNSVLSK